VLCQRLPKSNLLNVVNTSTFCGFFNIEERMSSITVSAMTQPAARRIEEIFTEHYQLVYRTACVITRNPDDAEDVLQEVFVRLLAKGVPRNLKNPKAYFYTAAVRASLNVLRTRRRYVFTDDPNIFETPQHPDTPDIDDAIRSELAQAVGNLSPRTVEILMLRYAEDLTEPQIAKLLGRSRGTVAVTLFRGLARLRKLLRRVDPG
jgi:RNA polymerase sigma-70 factor (ECF subfamily)